MPPRPLFLTGVAALVIGALLELDIYRRGPWPSVVTWLLMMGGLVLLAIGATRSKVRGDVVIWAIVGLLVAGLLALWLLGPLRA
jgi:hypothetical protein